MADGCITLGCPYTCKNNSISEISVLYSDNLHYNILVNRHLIVLKHVISPVQLFTWIVFSIYINTVILHRDIGQEAGCTVDRLLVNTNNHSCSHSHQQKPIKLHVYGLPGETCGDKCKTAKLEIEWQSAKKCFFYIPCQAWHKHNQTWQPKSIPLIA